MNKKNITLSIITLLITMQNSTIAKEKYSETETGEKYCAEMIDKINSSDQEFVENIKINMMGFISAGNIMKIAEKNNNLIYQNSDNIINDIYTFCKYKPLKKIRDAESYAYQNALKQQ